LDRGEIWHVDLDPVMGREQQGRRFVLIISTRQFNLLTGVPIAVPITIGGEFARNKGFAVSLSGAGTRASGIVRCDQPRTLDLKARNGRRIEKVPDFIVDDVLARVTALFE
jgi:mRNA interferase ChpB